jgi:hypothetical protein
MIWVRLALTAAALTVLVVVTVNMINTLGSGHHRPVCVITGFSPGPGGHPIYTYSPAGCVVVNSP